MVLVQQRVPRLKEDRHPENMSCRGAQAGRRRRVMKLTPLPMVPSARTSTRPMIHMARRMTGRVGSAGFSGAVGVPANAGRRRPGARKAGHQDGAPPEQEE